MSAHYPDTPGFKGDPHGPGAEAAAAYTSQVGRRQRQVLDGFRRLGSATCEQVGESIGVHWYLCRPRASELVAKGLLVATGDRGASALGGHATIYRPATAEETALFNARKAAEAEHAG